VLVLGVGNMLLRDDGIGLEILKLLADSGAASESIELVDGGTQGLALLPRLEGRRCLLVLDAVARGATPGTVHVLEDTPAAPSGPSPAPHGGNTNDLLNAARLTGTLPRHVCVVGVEPAVIRTGLELSHHVQDAIPAALAAARSALDRLVRAAASPVSA